MGQQAQILAKRLQEEKPGDLAAQVAHAIRLTTARTPENKEILSDVEFIKSLQAEEKLTAQQALQNYCLVMLNTNELIYLE